MSETLGEKLRAAREERGISISEVAEQTRIAPMYIECIENDNYKPLPGGIFNKGFVKSYARFIGFDEQEALNDYGRVAAAMEAADADPMRAYRPEVLTDDRTGTSTLPTIIIAGIILALMTVGILFLVNYLQSDAEPGLIAANNSAPANQAANVNSTSTPPEQPSTGAAPTMDNLRVEFRTSGDQISLSATSDGNNSINTVTATSPQTFEPRQSLKLSYAKSLSASAQLFINGRQIVLPSQPANPRRVPIEIEINSGNLAQIWSSGAITFGTPAATQTSPATVSPTPGTTPTQPATERTPGPTPAAARPAATPTPRRTPTPIVVGNANRTTPRSTPD